MKAPKKIRKLLAALDGVTGKDPQWQARCPNPAHPDKTPSFGIKNVDGRAIVNCLAGCSWADIKAGLGSAAKYAGNGGTGSDEADEKTYYVFTDAAGTPLFREVRMPGKKAWLQRPDPEKDGEWVNGLDGMKRDVLYRLPSLKDARRVFIVEGPKDAETLVSLGFIATTPPGGAADKWLRAYTDQLKQHAPDAELILLADNDEPGMKKRALILDAVTSAGRTVRVVDLPGVDEGEDVTDWTNKGHTRKELEALVEQADQVRPPGAKPLGQIIQAYLRRQADPDRRATPVPTGLPSLDKALGGGLLPSRLTYIGGPTGIMKTALGVQILEHVARSGREVAFYSLELSEDQVTERTLTKNSGVPVEKIRAMRFTKKERDKVIAAAEEFNKLPFALEANFLSYEQIENDILTHPDRAVILIDYFQLLFTGVKFDRGRTAIEAISAALMKLRKRVRSHLIVLSSVNSLGEPRESRQLMYDADVSILLGAGTDDPMDYDARSTNVRQIMFNKPVRDGGANLGDKLFFRRKGLVLVEKAKAEEEDEDETFAKKKGEKNDWDRDDD